MKREFIWGAGLLAGLSLLCGCERLWRSALTCAEDRSLVTDDRGEPYCQGSDLGTPTSDGGLGQWPVPPVTVTVNAANTHLVNGLRVSNPITTPNMRSLNIFFEGQSVYGTSLAGCDTSALSASLTADFGGVIYDANAAEYGYTIYQSKPGTMSVKVSRSPGTAVSPFFLTGATLPGFSFVDFDPNRRPIFSVINTDYSAIQWAYFDTAMPTFGTLPIVTSPTSTSWHLAHADFNRDGYPDFVLSTGNAAGVALVSGCLSSGAPCGQSGVQMLGTGNELLAAADFSEGPQLVRVFLGSTAQLGLSRLVPASNQTPITLSSASQSYRFPAGYEPRFLTAASPDGGQTVSAFVAGLHADTQIPTVLAFKLSSTGALLAPQVELPLRGVPTAMAMGTYPCATKQQLVIAQTLQGSSMILVYEPPSF